MGFSPFWQDDEEEAAEAAAAAAVAGANMAAATAYVSAEASRLEAEYSAKYASAQAEFDKQTATLTTQKSELSEWSSSLTNDIQLFNDQGRQTDVAAANNGTPQSYSIPTQPIDKKGLDPIAMLAIAAVIYFVFIKKG